MDIERELSRVLFKIFVNEITEKQNQGIDIFEASSQLPTDREARLERMIDFLERNSEALNKVRLDYEAQQAYNGGGASQHSNSGQYLPEAHET